MSALSWSRLNDGRRRARERWPTIWALPRTARSTRYAAERIPAGAAVLDIGGSRGGFGGRLAAGVRYATVDVDPEVDADHRSLAEVADASVDVVVSFETIEHMTLGEAAAMLAGAVRVLRPGGHLFCSTPNIHHPWSYLRSATHKTPFCYDELAGLAENAGLAVEAMLRCHRDAPLKAAARALAWPFYRVLGVDYCKSILLHARRPEGTR